MDAKRYRPMGRKKSKPIMEYDVHTERFSIRSAVLILLAAALTAGLLYKLGTMLLASQSNRVHYPRSVKKQMR
jgi:hypothetical protein